MDKGLLSSILDWLQHPIYSEGSIKDYAAFLVLVLIASFMWSTVVREIV